MKQTTAKLGQEWACLSDATAVIDAQSKVVGATRQDPTAKKAEAEMADDLDAILSNRLSE